MAPKIKLDNLRDFSKFTFWTEICLLTHCVPIFTTTMFMNDVCKLQTWRKSNLSCKLIAFLKVEKQVLPKLDGWLALALEQSKKSILEVSNYFFKVYKICKSGFVIVSELSIFRDFRKQIIAYLKKNCIWYPPSLSKF